MTVFDESHLAESPFLVTAARAIHRSTSPLVIPWPMPGNMGGFRSFMEFAEWKGFLDDFKLSDRVRVFYFLPGHSHGRTSESLFILIFSTEIC